MEHASAPTRRIVEHFCCRLGLGRCDLVVFENVGGLYTSEAWCAIVEAGVPAGYTVVAGHWHTLDARKSSRAAACSVSCRASAAASTTCGRAGTRSPRSRRQTSSSSATAWWRRATRWRGKRYGITDDVLAGQHEMSDNKRQRLEAIVTGAGTTLDKVTRRNAPAAVVIDLGKSPQWSKPDLACGYSPTVTASHGPKSLYALHR